MLYAYNWANLELAFWRATLQSPLTLTLFWRPRYPGLYNFAWRLLQRGPPAQKQHQEPRENVVVVDTHIP